MIGNTIFHVQDSLGKYRLNPSRRIASILTYHGLETDPNRLACNYLDITLDSCLKEIRFFQKQGYELVSVDELDGLADRGGGDRAYLVVSFDDGFLNTFEYIRNWLRNDKIPIMIAVCPALVENNGIFWWDEVRARFDLMRTETIELNTDGNNSCFSGGDAMKFEEKCERLPHDELLSLLCQLRNRTDYLDDDQIRASRYFREVMNWDDINELAGHPLCTLASHSLEHEIAINVSGQMFKENALKSKQIIEEKTSRDIRHYVYPNGLYSVRTDKMLSQCGFLHTFSTDALTNCLDDVHIRLNRFRGIGFGNNNLRYYAHKWNNEQRSCHVSGSHGKRQLANRRLRVGR